MVEAAGVEPASESTSSWDSTCVSASGFWCPACGSGKVPPGLSLGTSRRHAPRRRVPTSLFNGVRSPTTRRGQGERHCLIKQRERTDCPQLTDVPSDLRVNGARHASRDSVPPSKPNSPPTVDPSRTRLRCAPQYGSGVRTTHCNRPRSALPAAAWHTARPFWRSHHHRRVAHAAVAHRLHDAYIALQRFRYHRFPVLTP
jgi:hypothetical protein